MAYRGRIRQGFGAAIAAALTALAAPDFASAATFSVNSTTDAVSAGAADGVCDADPGAAGIQCSIREALKEEAALGGQDDIVVPAGTYPVSQFVGGPLTVADDARVLGEGAEATQIFATGGGPIFSVNSTAEAQLRDLTLRDGHGSEGGAVHSAGSLVVLGSVLRGNRATRGGAIWSSGSLRVTGSTIRDNRAESGTSDLPAGGGIYTLSGPVELADSQLIDNTAESTGGFAASGGGIFANGPATIAGSVIRGNRLLSTNLRRGGGLLLQGQSTMTRSTLEQNAASLGGGAYVTASGSLSATDSTIFGNQVTLNGGGVYADGSFVASNSTMTFNFTTGSPSTGGGVYLSSSGSLGLIQATLVDNLSAGGDAIYSNAVGGGFIPAVVLRASILFGGDQICAKAPSAQSFLSLDFNVVGDATCGAGMAHDRLATDPQVGQLAANGGPTQTHALLPGSPAIDLVASGCPPPAADQRGVLRPAFVACDAGAFELSTSGEGEPPPTGTPPPPIAGGGDKELTLEVRARERQRLRRLAVFATCPQEACELDAGGRATAKQPKRTAKAKRKRFALKQVSAELLPGAERKLRLKPKRKATRKLTRLLKRGSRSKARIDVSAQDAAGNASTELLVIRLRP